MVKNVLSIIPKYLPIFLYGGIIVLVGIFLLCSKNSNFSVIQWTLGIALAVGAVVAFIAALSRQRKQVQFSYHEMHALAMLVYGVSILLFCDSFEKLTSLTSFLFIFYAASEIIFCSWLFNLARKVVVRIVIIRLLIGLVTGIGTVVAMNYPEYTIEIFGSLFILVGINIMLYVPVMKRESVNEISPDFPE